ncbi:Hsp70 family protein [Vulgatibacter incomptus]|uniref:Chaperone protein DnaK n=1 Tax=Vulgatibacter incomptus TaxID=1391653 RepID=A0A0K1PB79_9BACT|nr:Hsp70 family protein [Vulgatibacter incomptus]AKU90676.1 Chaperone protein DnaK [Vulgatibacter incomptus]
MTEEIAIGIDLGTSYSCVSIATSEGALVVPNEWGELNHASVVSFLPDGSVAVGNAAKRNIVSDPTNTVSSSKRLIGRFFFSEEVSKARALMPYALVEGPNNSVRIAVRDLILSIPEVSALVLKEMKAIVESHLGHEVTKAVITCPAYFNDNQRQATKDAGRIAGLDVLRIINEPTAAALAYGFGRDISQRIAVYDLGGGTFDISILEIGKDVFEVLSTGGDTYLGGDDFDQRVMAWLTDDFLAKTGLDLRQNKWCLAMLNEAAEKAKIECGRQGWADIHIAGICQDANGNVLDLTNRLTTEHFNRMVMDLVQRTFKVCDEALQSARLTASSIDAVILVGGPTRLPVIRESVKHYFGREPMEGIDPEQVVSMGAALQARALSSADASTYLLDVTPLPLRIATVGGFTETILDKNTPVPIERSKVFTTGRDGQERVKIRVLQGENPKADGCESLGEFEFSGFRVAGRGEVQIEVTFEIDTNGIVNVRACDLETGNATGTRISLSSGLSEGEILDGIERNRQIRRAGGA